MIRQKVIKFLLENNLLVNPAIIEKIPSDEFNISLFYKKVLEYQGTITDEVILAIISDVIDNNLSVVNSQTVLDYDENIDKRLKRFNIKLVENYVIEPKKKEIGDFISHYNRRFDQISNLLKYRTELDGAVSISRLKNFQKNTSEKQKISLIGTILEKNETKNNNFIFTLEDKSGTVKILITKSNPELYEKAKDIMLDEVVGITGSVGEEIIYAENVIFPDIPRSKSLKKSPTDECAVFISDLHVGSKVFKKEEFLKFIEWINCEYPDVRQKEIAKKVKYLFIVGDLVEGIGIFPSQEQDVEIKDVYEQYKITYELLSKIRKDICIIISSGNHDPMRIAEPQPMHYKDYAKKLYEMDNVVFVSSPSVVSIGANENFEGICVLLYHGFSIPFYADQVPSIRKAGGQKRIDLVMKYFLERRHLAPTHTSTQFVPDNDYDRLVISKVPDIFATGHIHKVSVSDYKGVKCLNCSCWLGTTDYQIKLGIQPQPCRAILVNLQSSFVNILKFGQDEYEKEQNAE